MEDSSFDCEKIRPLIGSWQSHRQNLEISCDSKSGIIGLSHSILEKRSSTNNIWGRSYYFLSLYSISKTGPNYTLSAICGDKKIYFAGQIVDRDNDWDINLKSVSCTGGTHRVHFEGYISKKHPDRMDSNFSNPWDRYSENNSVQETLLFN